MVTSQYKGTSPAARNSSARARRFTRPPSRIPVATGGPGRARRASRLPTEAGSSPMRIRNRRSEYRMSARKKGSGTSICSALGEPSSPFPTAPGPGPYMPFTVSSHGCTFFWPVPGILSTSTRRRGTVAVPVAVISWRESPQTTESIEICAWMKGVFMAAKSRDRTVTSTCRSVCPASSAHPITSSAPLGDPRRNC